MKLEKRSRSISTQNNWFDKPFAEQPVDIIIPFHGQYKQVRELVDSIYRCSKNNPYKIVLVDDCSPNDSFVGSMASLPRIVAIRNDKQLGYGASLWKGFSATNNPWVVFLDSDCLVTDTRWLLKMGGLLLKYYKQNVRMVSPKLTNITCGHPRVKGNTVSDDFVLDDEFLPLHCVMCHRELFKKIKGFIKPYPYGFFEDEEIAYRMKKYGLRQAITGDCIIEHVGGLTVKELWKKNPEIKQVMENNRTLCIQDLQSNG